MGGAMAPPMKELPRWLLENPEFSIAPDWTDIVKQSVSNQSERASSLHNAQSEPVQDLVTRRHRLNEILEQSWNLKMTFQAFKMFWKII